MAVVDASVIAAFLLREEDGHGLDTLLQEVAGLRYELRAPSHFHHEILTVLTIAMRKGRIPAGIRMKLEKELNVIPIVVEAPPNPMVRREICAIADQHGLTV